MSSTLAAVPAVLLAILLAYPGGLADQAVRLHLRNREFLAWLFGYLHSGIFHLRLLALNRTPSRTEELARFLFNPNGADLGTVNKVHVVLDQITELTNTPVTSAQEFDHLKAAVFMEKFHDLGFQTESPANDFRGAGQFGFELFEYFCSSQPIESSRIIAESGSAASSNASTGEQQPWYPVALVSIRLSMKLSDILHKESLLVLRLLQIGDETDKKWLDVTKRLHMQMLRDFHAEWINARESGRVKHYFDTEFVLKEFEGRMPLRILNFS